MAGVRDNLVGDENPKKVWNGPWRMPNALSPYKRYEVIFYKMYLFLIKLINAHENKNQTI